MRKHLIIFALACMCAMTANARVINLATLTHSGSDDYTSKLIQDGDTLIGSLDGKTQPIKLVIAANASIVLKSASIGGCNGASASKYPFAGLTCNGDVTITFEGNNYVRGFSVNYPGIYIPKNNTLTIKSRGEYPYLRVAGGRLDTSTTDEGASSAPGLGGGRNLNCGNIVIQSGRIVAYGGPSSAAIGGGYHGSCGQITITGGDVTANGYMGAGIGAGEGGSVGQITISGGTVTAAGHYKGAGIGGSESSTCAGITIANTVTKVTATKGSNAPYAVGNGASGSGANVTIDGVNKGSGIAESPFVYPFECTLPTNVSVANVTTTSATVKWDANDLPQYWVIQTQKDGASSWSNGTPNTHSYNMTNLTPNTKYNVRVKAICDYNLTSVYTDIVSFTTQAEASATCVMPMNVQMAELTPSVAKVEWTPGTSDQGEWYYQFWHDGAMYQQGSTRETSATLHPDYYNPGEEWQFHVKAVCTYSSESAYTEFFTFTIPAECQTPANLEVVDIKPTEALVRWQPGNVGQTVFYIVVTGNTSGDDYHVSEQVNATSYLLTGLTPGNKYQVEVEGRCYDYSWSDWAGWLPFSTPYFEGVDQITNDQSPISNKVLRDGKLFIEINGHIYDAQGKEVK